MLGKVCLCLDWLLLLVVPSVGNLTFESFIVGIR
jgi:hypothetical protein